MNRCEVLRTVPGTGWKLINISCYCTAHGRLGWVAYQSRADSVPTSALSLHIPLAGWTDVWQVERAVEVEIRTQILALPHPVWNTCEDSRRLL